MSKFKIHLPDNRTQDGAVPLSWCMHPEFAAQLAVHDVRVPYVYIIVTHEDATSKVTERRYAVPLQSMMTYIAFSRPGRNRVFAFVANGDYRPTFFKNHDRERWERTPLNYEYWRCGDERDARVAFEYQEDTRKEKEGQERMEPWITLHMNDNKHCPGVGPTHLAVDVPQEIFAEEPSALLAAWVNWTYKLPPQDSCEFKRRLFGYALHLQVLQFTAAMLLRVVFYAVLRLTLMANVTAKPIRHPLTFGIEETFEGNELHFLPVRWLRSPKAWWLLPVTPLVWVVGVTVALLAWDKDALSTVSLGAGVSTVWSAGVLVIGFAIPLAWNKLRNAMRSPTARADAEAAAAAQRRREEEKAARTRRELAEQEERERKAQMWYTDPTKVAPLVCTQDAPRKPIASVSELPPEQRTIALRLDAYKATTCKPYAK